MDFIKKGEGGAQPNISREKLISHLMPIPPLNEQYRIVKQIQKILPLIEMYSASQDTQDKLNAEINEKLKKSILQEAIQGKLVPQIEKEGTAQELLEQIKQEKQKLVKECKLKKSALTDSVITSIGRRLEKDYAVLMMKYILRYQPHGNGCVLKIYFK